MHYLHKTTATSVINFKKAKFAGFVVTDNGPQFLGEFNQFASESNFKRISSSPHYPQSNGQAEKAVHISKMILSQEDPVGALMTYRSTPLPSLEESPASLMMGKEIRISLPTLPVNLHPRKVDHQRLKVTDRTNKSKSKNTFNQKHPGDRVKIRTKRRLSPVATVICKSETPRSYIINVNGTKYRRNRRHIILLPTCKPDPVLEVQIPSDEPKDLHPTETRPTRVSKAPVWHQDYIVSRN